MLLLLVIIFLCSVSMFVGMIIAYALPEMAQFEPIRVQQPFNKEVTLSPYEYEVLL